MSKHNCRRAPEEKAQHDLAVKIRKMTDAQICEFIDDLKQPEQPVDSFLFCLDSLAGTGNGISTETIYKLREIAEKEGFINAEN